MSDLPSNKSIIDISRRVKFWLFGIKLSFRRRFFNKIAMSNSEVKNIVISPGGVATTFLIEYLSKYQSVNSKSDADGYKHLPYIPKNLKGNKVIFISGIPNDILKSLVHRSFHRIQSAKLGCVLCQFCWGAPFRQLLLRAIERQINNFNEHGDDSDILILKYEEIWTRKKDIASHFEIYDDKFISNFPPKKQRSSTRF